MLIIGTGGQGKEVLGVLLHNEIDDSICFFDEDKNTPALLYDKYKVYHSIDEVKAHFQNNGNQFITAIGHPRIREKLTIKIENAGGKLTSVISSHSFVFQFNDRYDGIIIQPGAVISHAVKIGKSCLLHAHATIGHSVEIGNYVTIGPGVAIIGPTVIGNYCHIGAKAVILPGLKTGNNVIVGAGAVVSRDLRDHETYLSIRE